MSTSDVSTDDFSKVVQIRCTLNINRNEDAVFVIKRNGTGICLFEDESETPEPFDVAGIDTATALFDAAFSGALGAFNLEDNGTELDLVETLDDTYGLEAVFYNQVNTLLDDPIIDPSSLDDQDLKFDGEPDIDETTFKKIVQLAQLIYMNTSGYRSNFQTSIECSIEEERAELSAGDETPPALVPLLSSIIGHYEPTGWTYEYNDGVHDRQSGYSQSRNWLTFDSIDALNSFSVREQIKAEEMLYTIIAENQTKLDLRTIIADMKASLKIG